MRFACGHLKWAPEIFWSATLAEVESAASIFISPEDTALPRMGLARLMARFPDEQEGRQQNGI